MSNFEWTRVTSIFILKAMLIDIFVKPDYLIYQYEICTLNNF